MLTVAFAGSTGFSGSWFGADASWCTEPLPPRPPLPQDLASYDDGWIPLIEARVACSHARLSHYGIACLDGDVRTYRFPAGVFGLSQQVWLPPRTAIEGAADPNVQGSPRQRPDLSSQTLFVATTRGCEGNITAPKMAWPMPQVQVPGGGTLPIKCVRKGFLMNDDTRVAKVNGQGLAEDGQGYLQAAEPQAYAGLNGGGFFELPGCVTSYATDGGGCGRSAQPGNHGEGGNHGVHFVTGVSGRGVANVVIENVRLNDALDCSMDPHAGAGANASWAGFWSAMAPDGSAHRNITLRWVVAMRTLRDGVNVHGAVVGWTGEDLHFENQGDDVYAVWGAGGGADADQTGFSPPYAKCDLSNAPASGVTFRRTFAKGISDWSSCAHLFGAGTVVYDGMLCCSSPSQSQPYPALQIASTFCADYPRANVTFRGLRWYDSNRGTDLCQERGGPSPVYASAGSATGWKAANLHIDDLGCRRQ